MQWWKQSVVYQIYPRSFQDSNGDGVGDIPGIILRLDELRELGVGVIWLSPVYRSPGVDNGYDISDYRDIDPKFGTLLDMDRLIAEAKERGMRIIMDLVINHTSDQHSWFQMSRRRMPPYEDYYIWSDKPNNWTGFFGGGVWQWDELRGQYYLHLFAKEQPDLNWRSPDVMAEIQAVMRFWLDRGVAGFRCDVINLLYKQSLDNGKRDLIITGLEHYISAEGTHEILRRLRSEVLNRYDCFTVGETVFVTPKMANDLCAPERGELDMVFGFEHMETDQIAVKWFKRKFDLKRFGNAISKWQNEVQWSALYLENHDQPRSVSRFGDDGKHWKKSAKLLCTMLMTLRGTPFIYQGQEIGMTNFDFTSIDDIKDVESRNIYNMARKLRFPAAYQWKIIRDTSRDNARQPMQWDDTANAGFTVGRPWLKANANYMSINYAAQKSDPNSVLNYYKKMIAVRAGSDILLHGSYRQIEASSRIFAYEREYEGERLTVLLNFSDDILTTPVTGDVLIGNYDRESFNGTLFPWEAAVIEG